MTIEQARPLLDFIAIKESDTDGDGIGNFDAVYGGIKRKDRPADIRKLTVQQVLDWQDSIDRYYMSEAAGYFQIMEDTLRGLWREAGVKLSDLYDEATQYKLGYALLRRRGWDDYIAGSLDEYKFANALAKEWASLPVVTGHKKGRSYYAGDGLNKAHVRVSDFLDAVRRAGKPAPFVPAPTVNPLLAILQAVLKAFARGK